MDRRSFLHGSAISLSLPFLPSLFRSRAKAHSVEPARRLVCVGTQLGFYKPRFFANSDDPKLIRPLDDAGLADKFTTFSGLDHKGPTGQGHELCHTLLTGTVTRHVSLDQFAAPFIGNETRYKSMQLCAGQYQGRASLSFTDNGIPMPVTLHPSVVYARIFGPDSVDLDYQSYIINSGSSLLDNVVREAGSLRTKINAADRHKLDEYFSSAREIEGKLKRRSDWLKKPFPQPDPGFQLPKPEVVASAMLLETESLMWDLMAMGIKNDSCRVFTLTIPIANGAIYLDGNLTQSGYHTYSHHGEDPRKIDVLTRIEERHLAMAARFLKNLGEMPDGAGGTLLDSTMTLVGSGMGDASKHRRVNYPLLLAGGGFKHRRHVECRTNEVRNEMACDLYVSILQKLGIEVDSFATSESDLNAVLT